MMKRVGREYVTYSKIHVLPYYIKTLTNDSKLATSKYVYKKKTTHQLQLLLYIKKNYQWTNASSCNITNNYHSYLPKNKIYHIALLPANEWRPTLPYLPVPGQCPTWDKQQICQADAPVLLSMHPSGREATQHATRWLYVPVVRSVTNVAPRKKRQE